MARTILMLGVVILFSGCASTKNIESEGGFSSYGIDFRPYTDKGFLITTESPRGDYHTIGIIEVSLKPKVKETTERGYNAALNDPDSKYLPQKGINGNEFKYYLVEILDVQKALDEIYRVSNEWGANAIFNLNINSTITDDIILKETIIVSGLAVTINKDSNP